MRLTDEQIAALRDDLTNRLAIKADMLAMGERIAFGSDSAIMRQASETVHALATEVLESRAEIANRRMCVNCGKYAPKDHDRTQPLPECVDKEGYSACTFDHTPQEAWQHWSQIAHDQRAEISRLTKERDEVLEEAIEACKKQERDFLDPAYTSGQPLASFSERFACDQCARAIRAMKDAKMVKDFYRDPGFTVEPLKEIKMIREVEVK